MNDFGVVCKAVVTSTLYSEILFNITMSSKVFNVLQMYIIFPFALSKRIIDVTELFRMSVEHKSTEL